MHHQSDHPVRLLGSVRTNSLCQSKPLVVRTSCCGFLGGGHVKTIILNLKYFLTFSESFFIFELGGLSEECLLPVRVANLMWNQEFNALSRLHIYITLNTSSVKCFVFGSKERRWWVRSRIYQQKEVHLVVYWIVHNSMVSLCSCIPKSEFSVLSMKNYNS